MWRWILLGALRWEMVHLDDDCDDGEVYRKYSAELMRFAGALAGPSGAEDLLATAFLGAMTSAGWREVENKRAYLYRVVLNEAFRARRSNDRRLRREERVARQPKWEPTVADHDVLAALRRLTVRQRAIVFLTYWADLTPSAVAETIDSSPRTVERELAAARQRLGALLS
jgi:RNA polymerase sigma factor (sigma-70 family)